MQRTQALRRLTPAISALNHQRESAIAPGLFALSFARRPFPQTVNSPQHKIAREPSSCRQLRDNGKGGIYLAFLNSAKAQDAYAYPVPPIVRSTDETCRDPHLHRENEPRECHLDTSRKRCDMTYRDPNPADSCSTEDRKRTSRRRPNMNAKILTFSSHGDTTLLEYDPATADMEEVNKLIAEYEAKTGAQPFDMATGERLEKVTREQNEVLMVHPIAGG